MVDAQHDSHETSLYRASKATARQRRKYDATQKDICRWPTRKALKINQAARVERRRGSKWKTEKGLSYIGVPPRRESLALRARNIGDAATRCLLIKRALFVKGAHCPGRCNYTWREQFLESRGSKSLSFTNEARY